MKAPVARMTVKGIRGKGRKEKVGQVKPLPVRRPPSMSSQSPQSRAPSE